MKYSGSIAVNKYLQICEAGGRQMNWYSLLSLASSFISTEQWVKIVADTQMWLILIRKDPYSSSPYNLKFILNMILYIRQIKFF
jgi:hypothetical protein